MVVAILISGASDVFMLKRGRKIKVNIKQMIPIKKKIYVFKLLYFKSFWGHLWLVFLYVIHTTFDIQGSSLVHFSIILNYFS
jgi:hypothetical protein